MRLHGGAVQYLCCDGTALHSGQDPTLIELQYGLKNRSLGLIHSCRCGGRVSC